MPVYPDGTLVNEAKWTRLLGSIPTSYTIFKQDSTYYGECNVPGGSDITAGTDAATVIQAAVTAAPNGKILLKSSLDLTSQLDLTSANGLILEGLGAQTVLTWTGSADTYMIDVTGADDVVLRNFQLFGQAGYAGEAYGIKAGAGTQRLRLDKTYIDRMKDNSITLVGSASLVTMVDVFAVNQQNNWVLNASNAVNFLNLFGCWVHTIKVTGSTFNMYGGCSKHITLDADESYAHVINGVFFDPVPTGFGSHLEIGETANTYNVTIDGCTFNTAPENYFIYINKARDVNIKGCVFMKHTTGGAPATYINITNQAYNTIIDWPAWLCDTTGFGKISDSGLDTQIVGYKLRPKTILEHHTAADTLLKEETDSTHTNLGAGGAIKLTLPQDAVKGTTFEFVVMTAQQLQIDPGAAGAIYINGAKQTDDKYVWADDEGESVKLVCDGYNDWIAIGAVGTWGVEA